MRQHLGTALGRFVRGWVDQGSEFSSESCCHTTRRDPSARPSKPPGWAGHGSAASMPSPVSSLPGRLLSVALSLWSGHLSNGNWTVTTSTFYTGRHTAARWRWVLAIVQVQYGLRFPLEVENWWVPPPSPRPCWGCAPKSPGSALISLKEEKDFRKGNE